jgi:hypothetical protein
MNKLLPKKQWHYLILGALLLAGMGAVFSTRFLVRAQRRVALNAMLLQMRSDPALWTVTEHDVSILILDIQRNNVAGLAIAPSGIFVSTRVGDRYFISDNAGKLSGLALTYYHKGQTDAFPLAVVSEDIRNANGWHLDLGLLLTIVLFSA